MLTNQPLRTVLQKPDLSERLLKWAVELGEFDISYASRPAIKSQVLADFIAELSPGSPIRDQDPNLGEEQARWELYVDGSSNKQGSGAGGILTGPDGVLVESMLRFEFPATNNEAEYEAMISGLQLANNMGIKTLRVASDS